MEGYSRTERRLRRRREQKKERRSFVAAGGVLVWPLLLWYWDLQLAAAALGFVLITGLLSLKPWPAQKFLPGLGDQRWPIRFGAAAVYTWLALAIVRQFVK